MLTYIIRRLLLMIPTLVGVTAVVFFVMALAPGGVGGPALDAEGGMAADQRQAMREYYTKRYGLGDPLIVQYGRWLGRVSPVGVFNPEESAGWGFRIGNANADADTAEAAPRSFGFKAPDLGESMAKRRPILALYGEALPVTLLLNVITTPIIYVLSILFGILAAKHRGKFFDITTSTLFLGLSSIPSNLAGILLIGFLASRQYLPLFPAGGLHHITADTMAFLPAFTDAGFQRGWLLDTAWHLVLPVTCLTYGGFAFLTKLTRGAVLDNLSSDFVRTARAKGVDERTVLFRHVFRNSMLPLITVAAGIIPGLLGGAIIIETIFSLPGVGKLGVEAVFARDRELVLATTLLMGVLGMLSRLLSDVCYAIADPRVSYE